MESFERKTKPEATILKNLNDVSLKRTRLKDGQIINNHNANILMMQ